MSNSLTITFDWQQRDYGSLEERATFAALAIFVNKQSITELEDFSAKTVHPHVYASGSVIAEWLVANFWRLRWEPERESTDWELSHRLGAAGGGYVWPDVRFTSDGEEIHIEARPSKGSSIEPIRYLRAFDGSISVQDFERAVEVLVQKVFERMSAFDIRKPDLKKAWQVVSAERADKETAQVRKLEALLGFDAEEAPTGILEILRQQAVEVGRGAVEEIAASEGEKASATIDALREHTRSKGVAIHVQGLNELRRKMRPVKRNEPWKRASADAAAARSFWGLGERPVTNDLLATLFDMPILQLDDGESPENRSNLAGGLRTNDPECLQVCMVKRRSTGRRFSLARLIGDHIASPPNERLLPATEIKTVRQKYQRAFAQEFLCPFDQLKSFLGRERPTDDDMDAAAAHFAVSPLLVRTTLVNHGALARTALYGT